MNSNTDMSISWIQFFSRYGNVDEHSVAITQNDGLKTTLNFSKDGKITGHISSKPFEEGRGVRNGQDIFKDLNPIETQSFVDNQYKKTPLNTYEMKLESGGSMTFTEYEGGYKEIVLFGKDSEMGGPGKGYHNVYLINPEGKLIHAYQQGRVLENSNNIDFPDKSRNDNDPPVPPSEGLKMMGAFPKNEKGPDGPPPPPGGAGNGPDNPPFGGGAGNDSDDPPFGGGDVGNSSDDPDKPKNEERKDLTVRIDVNGNIHESYRLTDGEHNQRMYVVRDKEGNTLFSKATALDKEGAFISSYEVSNNPDGTQTRTTVDKDGYFRVTQGKDGFYMEEQMLKDGTIRKGKTGKDGKLVWSDDTHINRQMDLELAKKLQNSDDDVTKAKAQKFLHLYEEKNKEEQSAKVGNSVMETQAVEKTKEKGGVEKDAQVGNKVSSALNAVQSVASADLPFEKEAAQLAGSAPIGHNIGNKILKTALSGLKIFATGLSKGVKKVAKALKPKAPKRNLRQASSELHKEFGGLMGDVSRHAFRPRQVENSRHRTRQPTKAKLPMNKIIDGGR